MNRAVVVTGSSSGIGQAIAVAFAGQGDNVFVHGRRNEAGLLTTKQLVQEARSLHHGSSSQDLSSECCCGVLADLSEDRGLEKLLSSVRKWKQKIDVWINAAGADVLTGENQSLNFADKLDLLWCTDVRATMLLSRSVAERMKSVPALAPEPAKPCIINLSWDQAEHGMAGDSGQYFAAVKAAVAAFTRSLAMSVGPEVRVNAIAPGWIQTAWGNSASDDWKDRAVGESSLRRWGTPQDIASAALWLADSASEFVNGQIISVNGGWRPNY